MADSYAVDSNLSPSCLDDPNKILHLLAHISAPRADCALICVVSLVYFSFTLHCWLIIFRPICQLVSAFHKSSIECKTLRGTIQGAAIHITLFLLLGCFYKL